MQAVLHARWDESVTRRGLRSFATTAAKSVSSSKERDDMISSVRYAIMMRRFAKQPPSVEGFKPKPRRYDVIGTHEDSA